MEKFGWAGTYLLLAAAGIAAFITGAPSAKEVIGIVWVVTLSALVSIGGLGAAYGTYRDYRFEMGGILTVAVGTAMYGTAIWYIASRSDSQPFHTALFITAIVWASLMRFLYINHVRHRVYAAIDANEQLEQSGH